MNKAGLYCKAYLLSDLMEFKKWPDSITGENEETDIEYEAPSLDNDTVVYIHENYSVCTDIYNDKNVIYDGKDRGWKIFCQKSLNFIIPEYINTTHSPETTAPEVPLLESSQKTLTKKKTRKKTASKKKVSKKVTAKKTIVKKVKSEPIASKNVKSKKKSKIIK